MNIAIIGAGNVGRALSTSVTRGGHSVTISDRDPGEAQAAAKAAGATAAGSSAEAVRDAAAVVFAVPFDSYEPLIRELGGALDGKILVDVSNRLNMQNPPAAIDGTSNAERTQALAPSA